MVTVSGRTPTALAAISVFWMERSRAIAARTEESAAAERLAYCDMPGAQASSMPSVGQSSALASKRRVAVRRTPCGTALRENVRLSDMSP